MRTLTGVAITLTLGILAYVLWRPAIGPALAQLMTRNQPETPADWTPKMRTWKNGILQ